MRFIFKAIIVALVSELIIIVYKQFEVHKYPALEDKYWGPGAKTAHNHTVTSAKINIPQKIIDDLYYRLNNTKAFHPSLKGVNQSYGIHTNILDNLLRYWKNEYNWTKRQNVLNKYPHCYVKIRGLKIHFVHIKPNLSNSKGNVKILPLLLVHGWPSSFTEFYEIIPKLTQPRKDDNFVFELIVPSLPGFVFSDASTKPGLSAVYIAQIFADLMEILGFEKYYLQGGDWGSVVVQSMAALFPKHVLGVHSNMCFLNTPLSALKIIVGQFWPSLIYEPEEIALCHSTANTFSYIMQESGYYHLQATKPDTIGVALRDSPIGLAAYILEKFSTLTNPNYRDLKDGGLIHKFTLDQLLDNIMLYWFTECMTSAMRIYAESVTNFDLELQVFQNSKIYAPAGCARFPYEILLTPRFILTEKLKNLVHLTQYEEGGHFAALELPDLFARDIYLFVSKVENKK